MDLQNIDLRDADLRDADLTGANLTGANLTGVRLGGADLTGANLTEADLTGAHMTGARLAGSIMTLANLTQALLPAANLSGADLGNADLRYADLTGADLTGADLTNADLRHANLTDADLTEADLHGTRITHPLDNEIDQPVPAGGGTEFADRGSSGDSTAAMAFESSASAPPSLIFRTDLGPNQTLAHISDCLNDLQLVMRIAERCALRMLTSPTGPDRSGRSDPEANPRLGNASPTTSRMRTALPEDSTREDLPAPASLSVTVRSVSYRNPLEVWFTAGASTALALFQFLTLVRDWSNRRRKGAAEATMAEAEAELWLLLVEQAKAGSLPEDPMALLNAISDVDIQAMRNLSRNPVTLELPADSEMDEREDGGDSEHGGSRS